MDFLKSLAVPAIVVGVITVVVFIFSSMPPFEAANGKHTSPQAAIAASFK